MKVYLSPLAEFKLDSIYDYLDREWSEKVKENFRKNSSLHLKVLPSSPRVIRNLRAIQVFLNAF
ncbi:hypothetical protein HZR84_01650 [Hyphobacterium sp. CCMP332]|nr:hypothetical protein HZR84_01650 [Hyphobacterium sp. CCMP332]